MPPAPSAPCACAADSTWSHGAASSASAGSPVAAPAASPPWPISSHTTDVPRVRPLSTQSLLVTSPSAAGCGRAAGRPRHHGRGARHRQRGGRFPAAAVQVSRGEVVGGPTPRTLCGCVGLYLGGVGWMCAQPSVLPGRRACAAGLASGSVAKRGRGRGRGRNGLRRARGTTGLRARPSDRCRCHLFVLLAWPWRLPSPSLSVPFPPPVPSAGTTPTSRRTRCRCQHRQRRPPPA